MSLCHQDKLIWYMGIARAEGVEFDTINCNNLTYDFSINNNKIRPGINSIKGIGEKTAIQFITDKNFNTLQQFVEYFGKNKVVSERLIKLGAFDHINNNRKGLWMLYQYRYCTGTDISALRKEVDLNFMPSDIELSTERKRLTNEFLLNFPKKKKVPKKITEWKPNIGNRYGNPSDEQIINLFKNYTTKEVLEFEKQYLGYYITSPLNLFKHKGGLTIRNAQLYGELECVIENIEIKISKKENPYMVLTVTDGIETTNINVWSDIYNSIDDRILKIGNGIFILVKWNERFRNFTVNTDGKKSPIKILERISSAN